MDIQKFIQYATYAKLAYGETLIPSGIDFEWVDGLKNPKPSDVQCLIIYEKDRIVFSFRGTNDIKKYLVDAQVRFKDLGNGIKVHSGFYNSLDCIYEQLLEIVKKTNLPIATTGHSLGGSLTRQFTYRLAKEENIFVKESVTIGEPRSCNRKAANEYNSFKIKTIRLIDDSDGVCNIPWLLGTYKHVLNEIFMDKWGNLLYDEPWYAHLASDLSDIIGEIIKKKLAIIDDHFIDNYLTKLNYINNRFTIL